MAVTRRGTLLLRGPATRARMQGSERTARGKGIHLSFCVCMPLYGMPACMHVYTYIHTHTEAHIQIQIYIHSFTYLLIRFYYVCIYIYTQTRTCLAKPESVH